MSFGSYRLHCLEVSVLVWLPGIVPGSPTRNAGHRQSDVLHDYGHVLSRDGQQRQSCGQCLTTGHICTEHAVVLTDASLAAFVHDLIRSDDFSLVHAAAVLLIYAGDVVMPDLRMFADRGGTAARKAIVFFDALALAVQLNPKEVASLVALVSTAAVDLTRRTGATEFITPGITPGGCVNGTVRSSVLISLRGALSGSCEPVSFVGPCGYFAREPIRPDGSVDGRSGLVSFRGAFSGSCEPVRSIGA
uniref:Putative secreted protein n=1 Tax=Ixodes ricinus TaxID=34613 RepID=A0A6B0V738_IXORI